MSGEPGLNVKAAASGAPTVRVRLAVLDPEALVTVKVTVFVPALAKAWLGFWAVLVAPSPKFQAQAAGLPADASVNCTDWPVTGEAGLKEKEAASAAPTVSGWLEELDPEALVTVRVTVFVPTLANAWLGFWAVLVVPSPKLQDQDVGSPEDVSVNWTACPTDGAAGEKANDEVSTDIVATVTVRLACLEPVLQLAIRRTAYAPALKKAWDGFFTALVAPSPKSQDQELGFPELVSANCTVCPGPGVEGLKTNDAVATAGMTVKALEALLETVSFAATSVTRRNPAEA